MVTHLQQWAYHVDQLQPTSNGTVGHTKVLECTTYISIWFGWSIKRSHGNDRHITKPKLRSFWTGCCGHGCNRLGHICLILHVIMYYIQGKQHISSHMVCVQCASRLNISANPLQYIKKRHWFAGQMCLVKQICFRSQFSKQKQHNVTQYALRVEREYHTVDNINPTMATVD